MFNRIIAGFKAPKKVLRYFSVMVKFRFRKKRGTLFFLGMDVRGVFGLIFRGYNLCYGFEPNPERFKKLQNKYGKYPNVKLFNVAVGNDDGEIDFNISNNNNGASSSIGNFNEDWDYFKSGNISMINTIKVPCINLLNFCKKNNITYIDDYISDIQGMDLEVLKTLKPMIDNKRIKTITCEVTKNEKRNIYSDLPDNTENGFIELLNENYDLISKGWGILADNKNDEIPLYTWEMDCRWKLKKDV